MNRAIRIFMAAAGLALLSGCAGFGLQEAQMVSPQGNAFDRALYSGYLDLSEKEFDEADYIDSDRFAERAMTAARGDSVQPEEIAARELPSNKVGVLTGARERLVTALASDEARRQPADAAEAQVSFDCWMQEQEENFQPDDIAACQNRFIAAMERLEPEPMAAPAPPPPPPAPMALPGPFVVYFDFDSAALTAQAQTELADVVQAAQKTGEGTINITGYTDLSGAEAYNQVLSERRANSVIELLVGSGVDAARIVGRGLGESNPVVQTEAPEQRNRRVEIEFQR
jgi:outer membrane protein OmpA-like peptidoglycan-associated protein